MCWVFLDFHNQNLFLFPFPVFHPNIDNFRKTFSSLIFSPRHFQNPNHHRIAN